MAKTESEGQEEHYIASMFAVEGLDVTHPYFQEVTGMLGELEVVEHKVVGDIGKEYQQKIPGTKKVGEINLKRQLTADKSFWSWAKDIRDGKIAESRRNGSLVMFNHAGERIGQWDFVAAWPSKWSASDLDAGKDDPMMEEVTLQIEGITRIS